MFFCYSPDGSRWVVEPNMIICDWFLVCLQVCAHSYDGHLYKEGLVCAYDFHYNLAVLKFKSETPFGPAKFGRMDKLNPANKVFVMGIYFAKPFEPMTAMGEYW